MINGLVIGSLYGLVGLGLTMIFGMMQFVNIVHGEFYMAGALLTAYLASPSVGVRYFLAILLGVTAVFCLAILIERTALKALRDQPNVTTTLATMGFAMMMREFALAVTKGVPRFIPAPAFLVGGLPLLGAGVSRLRLFALAVAVLIVLSVHLYLHKTRFGTAIRAVFQNRKASTLAGIDIDKVYSLNYGAGALLAALAGGILGTIFIVEPMMGSRGLLKAFVVVIVGGMGSLPGAFLAGLLLGLVEVGAISLGLSPYRDVFGFAMVILFLMFRPTGFFGREVSRE